jgi:pimeloyl-ACP methyl ester carboxylesterase
MKREIIFRSIGFYLNAIHFFSPRYATDTTYKLFCTPPKKTVKKRELEIMRQAIASRKNFTRKFKLKRTIGEYIKYTWGEGPVVLLVHGWGGRASYLASFVLPLVEAGYKVIGFDAPAHGDSSGNRTSMPEISQVISELFMEHGPFQAIIAHSLGGMATGLSMNNGMPFTDHIVTIGAPGSMHFIVDVFNSQLHLSKKLILDLKACICDFCKMELDYLSLDRNVRNIKASGLIIHDKNDDHIDYRQAINISKNWNDSELYLTEGLGHSNILWDKKVISEVIRFIDGGKSPGLAQ